MMGEAALQVYFGTYTHALPHVQGKGEGIYAARFDTASGALSQVQLVAGAVSPSYLALSPSGRALYAVAEVGGPDGYPHGAVVAFARDPATGALACLNEQPSHGQAPCYVAVDRQGEVVLVANYRAGSLAAYPIEADGSLGEATAVVQHAGSSVVANRQEGPHAHSILPSPDNRFVLAADLGIDRVMVYRLDPARGRLEPNDPPSAPLAPGSGPRHIAFHPNGRWAYVINELASTITAFAWDAERGTLAELQTVPTLPEGFAARNSTADLHVHPSGRFLYGSNRGHDSIAVFRVDPATGRLHALGHVASGGRRPRNFALDPSGVFLLAANQDSDTVVTFRVDARTGMPTPTGHVASVPTPVCARFAPAGR